MTSKSGSVFEEVLTPRCMILSAGMRRTKCFAFDVNFGTTTASHLTLFSCPPPALTEYSF